MLAALGSYFDDILPLPQGWERHPLVAPHRARMMAVLRAEFTGKPLWGFKDPRACRLLAAWPSMFQELGVRFGYVIMARHPDEVAASMLTRNGHSYNQSLLLTLGHMVEAERQTRGQRRAFVTYGQVMSDWRACVQKIGMRLGIAWPRSPESVAGHVAEFLDPSLRHHSATESSAAETAVSAGGADPRIARLVFGAYQVLTAAAAAESGEVDTGAMDAIRQEFEEASTSLRAWRPLRSQRDKHMKMHVLTSRLDEEVQRLTKENEELRREASRWKDVVGAGNRQNAGRRPMAARSA